MLQIGVKKFSFIKKVKNTILYTYVISDLIGEKVVGSFYEKELLKTNQKEFRIEKIIKRKGNKLYVKWNGYDNSFNTIIKGSYKMSQYFPPYRSSGKNIKVELDLTSYGTKTDLENVTHVDVSSFAVKTNLANLKNEVDKLDIAKLARVSNDLAKLCNVVKNDVVIDCI